MKNFNGLKSGLASLAITCTLAMMPSAEAGQQLAGLGGTNNVPAAATNDYSGLTSSIFDLSKTTDATLTIAYNGFSTTDQVTRTFTFDCSGDRNNWQLNWLTLTLAASFTNQVVLVTNLPAGYRPPAIRLHYVQCPTASTNYTTNLVVGCFTKTGI